MVIVSLKQCMPESYNHFCYATESNKQIPRERTLDLPFLFHHKNITSRKKHLSLAKGESVPYRFRGNFCSRVCLIYRLESFLCLLSSLALN